MRWLVSLVALSSPAWIAGCLAAPPAPVPAASPASAPPPAAARPYDGALPDFVQKPEVQALYRWAAANRAILQYFPCTCGCESEGHRSNWNCYVKAELPGGGYDWDPMSTACGACRGITRDVMRMLDEGHGLGAIRAAIEAKYGKGEGMGVPWPPT